MVFIIQNINLSLQFSLTALKLSGLWPPDGIKGLKRSLYLCYTFVSFMFLMGTFLILQIVDLCLIWGNLPLMTGTAFLLFTNISHTTKIVNLFVRRKQIDFLINDANESLTSETSLLGREIVKSCDRETLLQQRIFLFITMVTAAGWTSSAEKNRLPLPAWSVISGAEFITSNLVLLVVQLLRNLEQVPYPYDTSKAPAYQLTYIHQVIVIVIVATLNVSKDTLVTTLIAQTCCRLRLVGHALRNICNDLVTEDHFTFTKKQELIVKNRLRIYVQQHQNALEAAALLQNCFSEPTFAQLTVSLIIICVTAFQILSQTDNMVRLLSMGTYLLNMIVQVFLYCYQGHQLSVVSEELAGAAYEMPWYMCSVSTRRSILIVMQRCHRAVQLTAGGFTTLSLASFTAIIKLSYSMFTLLQQVNEKP